MVRGMRDRSEADQRTGELVGGCGVTAQHARRDDGERTERRRIPEESSSVLHGPTIPFVFDGRKYITIPPKFVGKSSLPYERHFSRPVMTGLRFRRNLSAIGQRRQGQGDGA